MTGYIGNIGGTTEDTFLFGETANHVGFIHATGTGYIFKYRHKLNDNEYLAVGAFADVQIEGGHLHLVDTDAGSGSETYGRLRFKSTGGSGVSTGESLFNLTPLPRDSDAVDYTLVYSHDEIIYRPVTSTQAGLDCTILTADCTRTGGNKSFALFTPSDTLWRVAQIKIETQTGFNGATSANWKVGTAANPTLFSNSTIKNNGAIVITPTASLITSTNPVIATFTDATDGTVGTTRLFARFERLTLIAAT